MNDFKKWEKQFFNNDNPQEDILTILLTDLVSPFFKINNIESYYGNEKPSIHRDLKLETSVKGWDPFCGRSQNSMIYISLPFDISVTELKKQYQPLSKLCILTDDFYMLVCFTLLQKTKNESKIYTSGLGNWLPNKDKDKETQELETVKSQLILSLENKLFDYFTKTGKIFK